MSSVIRGDDNLDSANVELGRAKAWVRFNALLSNAIIGSYNVSSITDNGSGDFTVNLATPMPNSDYGVFISLGKKGVHYLTGATQENVTPTSVTFFTLNQSGTQKDFTYNNVVIF